MVEAKREDMVGPRSYLRVRRVSVFRDLSCSEWVWGCLYSDAEAKLTFCFTPHLLFKAILYFDKFINSGLMRGVNLGLYSTFRRFCIRV